jgi:hypothetical protein
MGGVQKKYNYTWMWKYFYRVFWFLVIFSLDLTLHIATLLTFLTLISIAPTLVPYLLFLTDTTTLITSYPIDLATVLTTYPTNLATLLITYPTNLTIVLTTHPINLTTLHTQPPYWHKHFTNLVTLIR